MPNDLQDLLVDSPPLFKDIDQREAKFWSNYPVDPLGFTIDPRRPPIETEEEKAFQKWFKKIAKKIGINDNPDDPLHHYDYRAAFLAGEKPDPKQGDHWPSKYKKFGHPNLIVSDPKIDPSGEPIYTPTDQSFVEVAGSPENVILSEAGVLWPQDLVEEPEWKRRELQTEYSIGAFGRELLEYVPTLKGVDPDAMYNIPSIEHGQKFEDEDRAKKFAAEKMRDTKGWIYPHIKGETEEETKALAKKAAQNRSDSIQGGRDSYGLSRLLFER